MNHNSFSPKGGNSICTYEKTRNEGTLNILYTNADVLTVNKLCELETLIDQSNYDIIAITEIFPKHSYFDKTIKEKYIIKGYNQFFANETERGTAIYVKSNLKASEVENTVKYK